jgi:hypothetical protein
MFDMTNSKYVDYMECNNRGWLDKNRRNEKLEEDLSENATVQGGLEAGIMARGIFGDYTLIDDGSIDELASKTQLAINNHTSVICEATFKYNNNICKVDILKRNDDGSYSIYEVKGVTNPYTTASRKTMDRKYIDDIAYQYYVLTNLGINVTSNYLVYLNNEYVYDGHYDLNNLFIIENLTNAILLEFPNVESNIEKINRCINQAEEPEIIFASKTCKECPYNKHCYKVKEVPEKNSVLGLYKENKKYDYLNQGIKSFEDLRKNGIKLKPFNQRMIDSRLDNLPPFINNNELRYFLNSFKYPLYFFDFETYQNAIPKTICTRPYQPIPFQYSLHIMHEDGGLEHREYLASNYNEPRLDLIIQKINDLGNTGSIIAYNDSFEKSRIKELARDFPAYYEPLMNMLDRFKDLAQVFEKGYYYQKEISRTSIKDVLPSLFPNDPCLDYHNLDDVHKGDEASKASVMLPTLDSELAYKLRSSLLKYCCLDTFAMVKIYQFLKSLV